MTTMYGPPCYGCLHQTAETFKHDPWVCEVFPDGLPSNIFVECEECPHFKESESTVALDACGTTEKAAKAEPKHDGGLVKGKKLMRFQLPANPTAKDVEKLSKWVKEQ